MRTTATQATTRGAGVFGHCHDFDVCEQGTDGRCLHCGQELRELHPESLLPRDYAVGDRVTFCNALTRGKMTCKVVAVYPIGIPSLREPRVSWVSDYAYVVQVTARKPLAGYATGERFGAHGWQLESR